MRLHILLFLFFSLIIIPLPANAQKLLPESSQKKEDNINRWERARQIFAALPEDMKRELEAEAKLVYQECTYQGVLSKYHDCECISAYYLDERVLQGPDASKVSLQQAAQKECVDEAGVAGKNYTQCMGMDTQILPTGGLNQKDYCTCYANEMAKAYKNAPKLETQYLKRMIADAFGNCQGMLPQ